MPGPHPDRDRGNLRGWIRSTICRFGRRGRSPPAPRVPRDQTASGSRMEHLEHPLGAVTLVAPGGLRPQPRLQTNQVARRALSARGPFRPRCGWRPYPARAPHSRRQLHPARHPVAAAVGAGRVGACRRRSRDPGDSGDRANPAGQDGGRDRAVLEPSRLAGQGRGQPAASRAAGPDGRGLHHLVAPGGFLRPDPDALPRAGPRPPGGSFHRITAHGRGDRRPDRGGPGSGRKNGCFSRRARRGLYRDREPVSPGT